MQSSVLPSSGISYICNSITVNFSQTGKFPVSMNYIYMKIKRSRSQKFSISLLLAELIIYIIYIIKFLYSFFFFLFFDFCLR